MKPAETSATRSVRNRRQKSCRGERASISPPTSSTLSRLVSGSTRSSGAPTPMNYRGFRASSVAPSSKGFGWGYHTAAALSSRINPCTTKLLVAGYPHSFALVAQRIEHAPPKRGMQVRFLPGASTPIFPRSGSPNRWTSPRRRSHRPACYRPRVLVSERTLEAPPVPGSEPPQGQQKAAGDPWTLRLFGREHPWWATSVGLVLLSTLLVVVARTRPGFDPYGWLVWGHQTLAANLDTNAAPSWKPLPYLFTVPYALAGHYQLWLWMITAAAVSLSGVVFAGRIAYRLTDRTAGTTLQRSDRRGVRGSGAARDQQLLALHPELPVRSDDRRVVPRRDRLPPLGTAAVGVRARGAGFSGSARGLAVRRPVRGLGLARDSLDATAARQPACWSTSSCGSGFPRSPRGPRSWPPPTRSTRVDGFTATRCSARCRGSSTCMWHRWRSSRCCRSYSRCCVGIERRWCWPAESSRGWWSRSRSCSTAGRESLVTCSRRPA